MHLTHSVGDFPPRPCSLSTFPRSVWSDFAISIGRDDCSVVEIVGLGLGRAEDREMRVGA